VIDSKLTFRVQEVEEGKSRRNVVLASDDLSFEQVDNLRFKQAEVEIAFEKSIHFIQLDFVVNADIVLYCDRSLRPFDYHVEASYKVLFKQVVEELSEGEKSKVKQIDRDMCIRIDQEVRDTILLGVPVRKLHPDYLDEEGRPVEFDTKAFGAPAEQEEPALDPRWEALKKLKRES